VIVSRPIESQTWSLPDIKTSTPQNAIVEFSLKFKNHVPWGLGEGLDIVRKAFPNATNVSVFEITHHHESGISIIEIKGKFSMDSFNPQIA